MISRCALAVALSLSLCCAAVAQTTAVTPDAATVAASGKAIFSAKCGVCHGLDRPLGKKKDAAGWDTTVTRMIGKSPTSFAPGDKEAIIGYLTGKSLFEDSCGSCHPLERPLSAAKDRVGWNDTVARMVRYAKGAIKESDAALISGYLTAERPPKP